MDNQVVQVVVEEIIKMVAALAAHLVFQVKVIVVVLVVEVIQVQVVAAAVKVQQVKLLDVERILMAMTQEVIHRAVVVQELLLTYLVEHTLVVVEVQQITGLIGGIQQVKHQVVVAEDQLATTVAVLGQQILEAVVALGIKVVVVFQVVQDLLSYDINFKIKR